LIDFFLSNISTQHYENTTKLLRVIAENIGDVFVTLCDCLINAWPLRANEMGGDHSVVRPWNCRLNTFFYWTIFIWQ